MTVAPTPKATTMDPQSPAPSTDTAPCTLQEFPPYFLRLWAFGFGGPIANESWMFGHAS